MTGGSWSNLAHGLWVVVRSNFLPVDTTLRSGHNNDCNMMCYPTLLLHWLDWLLRSSVPALTPTSIPAKRDSK